jgi:hypothetical protein
MTLDDHLESSSNDEVRQTNILIGSPSGYIARTILHQASAQKSARQDQRTNQPKPCLDDRSEYL